MTFLKRKHQDITTQVIMAMDIFATNITINIMAGIKMKNLPHQQ